MCTPNGRFRTNVRLCLSMSDFHPETWCPLWSVSAVLTGLLSFMVGSEDTFGSIVTSEAEKIKMAKVLPIELFPVEYPRLQERVIIVSLVHSAPTSSTRRTESSKSCFQISSGTTRKEVYLGEPLALPLGWKLPGSSLEPIQGHRSHHRRAD